MRAARILGPGFWLLGALYGQRLDPVQWTLSSDVVKAPPGSTVPLRLTAKLDEGWHLYSLTTPKGGPIPTQADLAENPAVAGSRLFQPKPAIVTEITANRKRRPHERARLVSRSLPGPVSAKAAGAHLRRHRA